MAEKLFAKVPEPKVVRNVDCDRDYRYYPEVIEQINGEIGKFVDEYFK